MDKSLQKMMSCGDKETFAFASPFQPTEFFSDLLANIMSAFLKLCVSCVAFNTLSLHQLLVYAILTLLVFL